MSLLIEMQLEEALNHLELIVEDGFANPAPSLETAIDQAISQLAAAKRALGLANQLTNEASRKKHRSRVMGMLNKIRMGLWRLQDDKASQQWAHQ